MLQKFSVKMKGFVDEANQMENLAGDVLKLGDGLYLAIKD